MNKTYTLCFGDQEHDIEFGIEADIVYEPARISGPPEDCYPDASECTITSIMPMDGVSGYDDAAILEALDEQVGEDRIIEDLWEDYMARRFEGA